MSAYALRRYMEPSEEHLVKVSGRPFEPGVLLVLGLVSFLALVVRLSLFDFESSDLSGALSPWYDFIVSYGGFSALKYDFSNYSPLYLYFLTLATFRCPSCMP